MPIKATWNENEFLCQFFGTISIADFEEKNLIFSEDLRSARCSHQMLDFRNAREFDLSNYDIATFAFNDVGQSYDLKNITVTFIGTQIELENIYRRYVFDCIQFETTWSFNFSRTLEQARTEPSKSLIVN